MGQAKQRGNFEQRKAESIARKIILDKIKQKLWKEQQAKRIEEINALHPEIRQRRGKSKVSLMLACAMGLTETKT